MADEFGLSAIGQIAILITYKRHFEPVIMLNKIEGELPFDA